MWVSLGTFTPSGEWQYLATPLSSRLLRLTYQGDAAWLEKYQPRLYLRLRVSDEGRTQEWETTWPKSGERELVLIDPVALGDNFLDIRKRRDFESLQANYQLTVEEYQDAPYLIASPPFNVNGSPLTVGGTPVNIP